MSERRFYSLGIILILFVFISCKKEIQGPQNQNHASPQLGDISVNAEFDWKLTREIDLNIIPENQGMIKISSADESVVYHKGFYSGKSDSYRSLFQIPKTENHLLINGKTYYPVKSGQFKNSDPVSFIKDIKAKDFKSIRNLIVGDEFVFSDVDVMNVNSIVLDDNRFLVAYFENIVNGYYGEAKVVAGTISGDDIIFGNPLTVVSSEKKSGKSPFYTINCKMSQLNENKVVLAFRGNEEYLMGGMAMILNINGNTITQGNMFPFLQFFGQNAAELNVITLSENKFALVYGDTYYFEGAAMIGEVNGNNIQYGFPSTFSFELPLNITAQMVDNNHFVVGYSRTNEANAVAAEVVGNMIFFQNAQILDYQPVTNLRSAISSSGRIVFIYRSEASGSGHYCLGSVSGNTMSLGASVAFCSSMGGGDAKFLDENHILLAYQNSLLEGTGIVRTGELSDNEISFNDPIEFDYPLSGSMSALVFSENRFAIAYSDAGPGSNNKAGTVIPFLNDHNLVDTDGDGIPDDEDDYPLDPLRAFDNFMPAEGPGSLSFEDLWPSTGDYDFNDAVIDYQFQTVTNANNEVVEIFARFTLRAVGASYQNGFGFILPEADPDLKNHIQVTGSVLTEGMISLEETGLESQQEHPTIIVYDNAFSILNHPGGLGINTVPTNNSAEPETIEIIMVPDIDYEESDFGLPYFNPFIFVRNDRGREIHLPDYPPSNLADPVFFGTIADASVPAEGIYYKSDNNLPWAVHIPQSFDYTIEKSQINEGYLHFLEWSQSDPQNPLYTDWYENLPGYRNEAVIY